MMESIVMMKELQLLHY